MERNTLELRKIIEINLRITALLIAASETSYRFSLGLKVPIVPDVKQNVHNSVGHGINGTS